MIKKLYVNYQIHKCKVINIDILQQMFEINFDIANNLLKDISYFLLTECYEPFPYLMIDFLYDNIRSSLEIHPCMISIFNKQYDFKNILLQMYVILNNLLDSKHNCIHVNKNLSFYPTCYRFKKYVCFPDICTNNSILCIYNVKESFMKNNNLTNIGLKYYEQMMIHACGFKYHDGYWPRDLIVINFYTGEIMIINQTDKNYEYFYKQL